MCLVFFFQAEDGIRDLVRSRGLGAARVFNVTENAVARTMYGPRLQSSTPYPWPPIYLKGDTPPTNSSTMGLLGAGVMFAVSLKVQHRVVWGKLSAVKLREVPTGKIEGYKEFLLEISPEAAAMYANVLCSSVVAAVVKPGLDGPGHR
eukprot:TRINITY_DN37765_c0_g1_i2.p1 TRINITY_DN37765_c0_g1~~TRINITY_DN37765_c0_g1_i2.p1  ORF type:complete len:148 (-),score=33.00 TRINITY_DN37765_c0_g1_i2:125-568(-)